MPLPPQGPKRTLEKPGRLAAIGGAVAVCVLTVSGALGLSPSGSDGSGADGSSDAALQLSDSPPDTSSSTTGGSSIDETPETDSTGDTSGSGSAAQGDSSSQQPVDTTLPAGSGTGRRVVFDMGRQRVWLVGADGAVARTYPVSGSKYDNLDPGTYAVTSRSEHATAYNSDETMRFMVRFAYGRTAPIGFHSIPAHPDGTLAETRAELGTPQSDGCIRQWITDARALWNFAPDGTKVVVLT